MKKNRKIRKVLCDKCPHGYSILVTEEEFENEMAFCFYCSELITFEEGFNCFEISEENAREILHRDFGLELETIINDVKMMNLDEF